MLHRLLFWLVSQFDSLFHAVGSATGLHLMVAGGVSRMSTFGHRLENLPVTSVEGALSIMNFV